MRPIILLLGSVLPVALTVAEDAGPPISPEEALKRVDQKVTVLMQVKSTGGNTARFLNSQSDFRDDKNFAVFIPHLALTSFKEAGVADPGQYYKGKTILVTGTVVMSQGRPVLRADNADQIKLVNTPAVNVPAKRKAK
jgi:hypothetical protein